MKVQYYKEKTTLAIQFESKWEELQFRMLVKTWGVQDDKLEELLMLYDETKNKGMVEIPLPAAHNYRKKKAGIIKWFINKMFGFDISKQNDVALFADGVAGMVAIGKLIEYTFQKAHDRKIVAPGKMEIVKEIKNKLIN